MTSLSIRTPSRSWYQIRDYVRRGSKSHVSHRGCSCCRILDTGFWFPVMMIMIHVQSRVQPITFSPHPPTRHSLVIWYFESYFAPWISLFLFSNTREGIRSDLPEWCWDPEIHMFRRKVLVLTRSLHLHQISFHSVLSFDPFPVPPFDCFLSFCNASSDLTFILLSLMMTALIVSLSSKLWIIQVTPGSFSVGSSSSCLRFSLWLDPFFITKASLNYLFFVSRGKEQSEEKVTATMGIGLRERELNTRGSNPCFSFCSGLLPARFSSCSRIVFRQKTESFCVTFLWQVFCLVFQKIKVCRL